MTGHKIPDESTNLPRRTGVEFLAQFYKLIPLLTTDTNDKLAVLALFLFFLGHTALRVS